VPVSSNNIPVPLVNDSDLWHNLKKKSNLYKHDAYYLKKHPNIQPKMRAILIDWLIEV
jgi:cyclin E